MVENRGPAALFVTLLLLASALVAPNASAEVTSDTLYLSDAVARAESASDCQTMNHYAMSPEVPPAGRAYASMQLVAVSCPWSFEYTVAQDATISGDVPVHITISCEDVYVTGGVPDTTRGFVVELLHNGVEIAEAETSDLVDCVAGGTFTFDLLMTGINQEVAAEDVLSVEVVFLFAANPPPAPVSGNIYVVTGGDDPTYLTLPGLFGSSMPDSEDVEDIVASVFENLTAPTFLHAFDNATSDDYTLNFTVPWQNVTLSQVAEATAGNANVTVLRDGEVVLAFQVNNETVAAAEAAMDEHNVTEEDRPVLSGLEGNWSVVIDYTDFVGSLGLTVEEHVEAPEPVAEVNETAEPSLEADAVGVDAPGAALPLLGLALLGAVFVVRRRD